MKLAWILWLAQILPQPAAEPLCLATTIYLEARDQSVAGQRAVAEVALRRRDSGLWGGDVCAVVTARGQFAPSLIHPGHRLKNPKAWATSTVIAFQALRDWSLPPEQRNELVPGASHFAAHDIVSPEWATQPVAVIGDHSFYRVLRLAP
jgi:spore germination cell wall hydrolase CwlJ-like protein